MDETRFEAAYRQQIAPRADDLEALRQKLRLRWRLVSASVVCGAAVVVWIMMDRGVDSISAGFSGLLICLLAVPLAGRLFALQFSKQAKATLLPALCAAVGEVALLPKKQARTWVKRAQKAGGLPGGSVTVDDAFVGRHRETDFAMIETTVTVGAGKYRQTVFQGMAIAISVPVPFSGRTAIVRGSHGIGKAVANFFAGFKGVNPIHFPEDPEFETVFQVRAENEAEARNLLSSSLRLTLLAFADRFGNRGVTAAFHDRQFFLGLYDPMNRFEPVALNKPVGDLRNDVMRVASDLGFAFRIVDHLHDGAAVGQVAR